ncbi:FecR domain-containing protein [Verrucomicrobiaceae bacterium 227]
MTSNPKDTEALLSYLLGDLSADEVRKIEERLLEDKALRKQLLELSTEEAALTDWAKSEEVSASLDDRTFQDRVPSPSPKSTFSEPVIWLAAAAVLVLGFFGMTWWGQPEKTSPSPIASSQSIALFAASIDAHWIGSDPQPGSSLSAGQYQLSSGSVDLVFSDGAKVSVGGPAVFELKSARHLHLESGQAVARISDEALGFIVTSPGSEVIDLGTEFGLSVDASGQTDVHVLDGLVEVHPSKPNNASSGVTISEGQARRFENSPANTSTAIPLSSRANLLGVSHVDALGLELLRGSVRITEELSSSAFKKEESEQNWIDLIPEKQAISLPGSLAISIDSAGSYRDFETIEKTINPEAPLDSYLLHFRPGNLEQVQGIIRFDQPIVAILCTGDHLRESDLLFGTPASFYPKGANPFRGLEPNGRPTALNAHKTNPNWQPDEIVLSQDRHTISIRAFANTERGYDQVRILTRAR